MSLDRLQGKFVGCCVPLLSVLSPISSCSVSFELFVLSVPSSSCALPVVCVTRSTETIVDVILNVTISRELF